MKGNFGWHGGRLAEARAIYGEGREGWIDLSTGINPVAWPGAQSLAIDWRALPDPQALAELEEAAATHFGTSPDHVCAVPGSEIGLRAVGQLLNLPARYIVPGYRTHAEAFPDARPITDLTPPSGEPSALLLANPNNPDGRIIAPKRLRQLLDESDHWLLVDEAFADSVPECSIAGQVGEERPLIVLRSFGKFFGLAGVRLGFVLGPSRIIALLRRLLGEWPVSAAAIAIGSAAYGDHDWIARTVSELPVRARRLDALLAGRGLAATGDCPLFRLVETDNPQALFDRLARNAILTRPFDDNPRWLRMGLPAGDAEFARLDASLRHG